MSTPSNQAEALPALDEVVKRLRDLPTLPAVAVAMLRDLDNDDLSLDEITEKIALDHSISAKLLRLANSSHYGCNSRVVTLQQATNLLGVQNVKNLIRTTIINQAFPRQTCHGFDFTSFWQHSVATAVCAELLARSRHMKHEFAFTAGLLHDLGQLALACYYAQAYQQVLAYQQQQDCYLIEAELEVLGFSHVDTGFALAQSWHFSEVVSDAIRGHHLPPTGHGHELAMVVHIADAIAHGLDLSDKENELVPLLSGAAWDTLGLLEAECLAIFRETEMRCDALYQIVS